jgi:hypothetical protein
MPSELMTRVRLPSPAPILSNAEIVFRREVAEAVRNLIGADLVFL